MNRLSALSAVLILLAGTLVWLTPKHGRGGVNAMPRAKDGHHADAPRPAVPAPPRPTQHASRSEHREPLRRRDELAQHRYQVTAYGPTGHRTASGNWPTPSRTCASNLWPLGTRLRIEGVGVCVVEDRVGCCTDVDIFLPSGYQAIQFGRRVLRIEVLT